MSCKKYQELIDGFLDNHLEEYEAVLLQHHLKVCQRCKVRLKRSIALATLIKSEIAGMKVPQPGEDFSRKVISTMGRGDPIPIGQKQARRSGLAPLLSALRKPLIAATLAAAAAFIIVITALFLPSAHKERLLTVYELAKEKGQTMAKADDGIDYLINEHLYRSRQSSLLIDKVMIERTLAAK